MILTKLIVLDTQKEEANSFVFSDTSNIITSEDSNVGKSCLLKSIYYSLGFPIKTIQDSWNLEDKLFKLCYKHNGQEEFIIRHRNVYWVDNKPMNTKEYSSWLLNKLGINIKLALKEQVDIRTVYPSAVILPFYIDQDASWSSIPYKNVANDLNQYDGSLIPSALFEYIFNISTQEILEKREKVIFLNKEKETIEQQHTTLSSLKNEFIQQDINEYVFNEEEAKNEIKRYLQLANNINDKLNTYKSKIYNKKITLDKLNIELMELSAVIKDTDSEYKIIKGKCEHCGSILTEEQSLKRVHLMNNKYEASLLCANLRQQIKKLEQDITEAINGKLGLEEEYRNILSIADHKQGEITLQKFIEQQARKLSKDNFVEVKNNLYSKMGSLNDDINELNREIKKLQKIQKEHKDEIGNEFNVMKNNLRLTFPNAALNEVEFLKFKTIKGSGTVNNLTFFSLYVIYLYLLVKYSIIELPIGVDAPIKDELTEKNTGLIYQILEKYIMNASKQSFVVMLKDKLQYIKGNHNIIELTKPILDKGKYESLFSEFSCIKDFSYNIP